MYNIMYSVLVPDIFIWMGMSHCNFNRWFYELNILAKLLCGFLFFSCECNSSYYCHSPLSLESHILCPSQLISQFCKVNTVCTVSTFIIIIIILHTFIFNPSITKPFNKSTLIIHSYMSSSKTHCFSTVSLLTLLF